jgi:predicted methyltransferase
MRRFNPAAGAHVTIGAMLRKNRLRVCLLTAFALAGAAPGCWAQLAARKADDWITTLEAPQRVAGQKVDQVLANLSLKPGMVVADIGAGSGLLSRPLAKAVGPDGKVYAVDIQQDLLD